MWVDQLQGLEFSVEGLLFDTVDEHKSRSLRDVRHLFDLNEHLKGAFTSYGQPSCKSRHLNIRLFHCGYWSYSFLYLWAKIIRGSKLQN